MKACVCDGSAAVGKLLHLAWQADGAADDCGTVRGVDPSDDDSATANAGAHVDIPAAADGAQDVATAVSNDTCGACQRRVDAGVIMNGRCLSCVCHADPCNGGNPSLSGVEVELGLLRMRGAGGAATSKGACFFNLLFEQRLLGILQFTGFV